MEYKNDTICAISTPAGTGGIAVIRISGPKAIEAVDKIYKGNQSVSQFNSHQIKFGRIISEGETIDEVYVSLFKKPRSYTGEDVIEISCHGSSFIAGRILELLLQDIRLAEPGEFTQRAFLNNKIDLTQAEAVSDLLQAKTRKSHRAAIEQLQGSLHHKIDLLLERITALRTLLELEIDFLEQDLVETDREKLLIELDQLDNELKKLAATGVEGLILKEGFKISLVGAPNVGKSSIFNAFLETERAIVTPIPGTTRDYLEEAISLHGYLVRLFDTAGIRITRDEIEEIGIQRSYDIIRESHKILYISDGKKNRSELAELEKLVAVDRIIKVFNKTDLFSEKEITALTRAGYIPCNTVTPDGLEPLKTHLLRLIKVSDEELHEGILTNSRQIAAVNKAINSLQKAAVSLKDELGPEFTAFDLKEASTALEEIVGLVSTDDILHKIFSEFCIGK
jgi:tRNA modification GTPase